MTAFIIDNIEFRRVFRSVKADEIIQKPILEDFTSAVSKHIDS